MSDSVGRLIYIEPTEFAENKIKEEGRISSGSYADNISWDPEDLQYKVDLQVVCPDRYNVDSCVKRTVESNTYVTGSKDWISFLNGNTFGDENYLTDAYTEITFQEIGNNRESQKEALGIDSIDISFDSHFFPLVTIKFTDVRAAALFGPVDNEYAQNQRIETLMKKGKLTEEEEKELGKLRNKASSSFFKSLFHFPYPRFMLSVMGYYGDKVTFQLAVSDFKTNFNSSNGNFDVTVSFIGYMYGLYTDLPMSLVLTAPYYNGLYWDSKISKGVFEYNGGGKILKFVEFMDKYYHLQNDMYKSNSRELADYKSKNEQRNSLNVVLDDYDTFEGQFLRSSIIVYSREDDKKYILFYNKPEVNISVNIFERLIKDLKNYNEKFGDNLSLGDLTNYGGKSKISFSEIKDNKIPLKSGYEDLINTVNAKDSKFKDEKGEFKNECHYYTFFDRGSFLKDAQDKLDDVNKVIKEEKDNIDNAMADVIKDKLGFTPSVENIYRMIFAHIETFFNAFEDTESRINSDIGSGRRRKDFLGLTEKNSDVPKKSNGDTTIPPFPLCKDKDNTIVYPGTFYEGNSNILNISETDLIERIVNGVKKFSDDFKAAQEKIESLNDKLTTGFTPVTVSDIFYEGKNPYLYLKEKLKSSQDEKSKGIKIEYFFYARMMMYIMATNKHDFNKVFETEFENFKESNINVSSAAKSILVSDTASVSTGWLYNNGNDTAFNDCYFFTNPFIKNDANNKYKNNNEIFEIISEGNPLLETVKKTLATEDGSKGYSQANIELRSYTGKEYYNLSYITYGDDKKMNLGYPGDINSGDWKFNLMVNDYEESGLDGIDKFNAGILPIGRAYDISGSVESFNDLYLGGKGITGKTIASLNQDNTYFTAFLLLGSLCTYFNLKHYKFGATSEKYRRLYTMYSVANEDQSGNIISTSYFQNEARIIKHPKALLLFFGACVYFNLNGFDRININDGPLSNLKPFKKWTEINEGENFVNLFTSGYNIFLDKSEYIIGDKGTHLRLPGSACEFLKDYFENWVNNEFAGSEGINSKLSQIKKGNVNTISETVNNKNNKHKGKKTYFVQRTNDQGDNIIKGLLCENVYLYKCPEGDRSLNQSDLTKRLVDSLKKCFKDYPTTEQKKEEEQKAEERKYSDASKQKKALYYTLKRLYDKWLSSYKMQDIQEKPFNLKAPEKDKDDKKNRYKSNADKNSTSEFDSFIFVDSFFRDISDKYLINPDTLINLIESYSAKEILDSNASVFEFMNEIAEKNSLLFASIPVYSNFYDEATIEGIFTPNRKYGVNNSNRSNIPGNTYVIMYTGEASSKLDFGDDSEYEDDGITDVFGIGEPKVPDELSKILTKGDGDGIDYTVPIFGVTYGKQNQMYFKNITVNMDEPKVTDYSIANLIQISQGGKHGDSEGYDVGIGQDIYSIYANRSYTCTVEMLGCINIMPMMYFQLNNIPMFRGFYMIINVSHSIVPGNMTTRFTGVRVSKNHIGEVKLVFDYQSLIDKVEIGDSRTRENNKNCNSCEDVDLSKYNTQLKDYDGPVDGKIGYSEFKQGGGAKVSPTGKYRPFYVFGIGGSPNVSNPGAKVYPEMTGVECCKEIINIITNSYMKAGCKTIGDVICRYHTGQKTFEDFLKHYTENKCIKDVADKRVVCSTEMIERQIKYQEHLVKYCHMSRNTKLEKTRKVLYPLVTFISRQEQGKNTEAACDEALKQLNIT